MPWEILHYSISREKFEPEPSQEGDLNMSWHMNQDSSSGRAPGYKSGGSNSGSG